MVKMKALRTFGYAGVNEGAVKRGREFSVRDEHRAKDLEVNGLAFRIEAKPPNHIDKPAAPENKAAEHGPLGSVGGATGAEAPAPSSPPVQRQRKRRSNNSADDLLS